MKAASPLNNANYVAFFVSTEIVNLYISCMNAGSFSFRIARD